MANKHSAAAPHEHGSLKSYTTGFVLSLVFTFIPFLVVINGWVESGILIGLLMCFAIAQLLVQAVFFLHLGKGASGQWNLAMFGLMSLFVLIIVIGSLWIMDNLDYRMGHPAEVEQQLLESENLNTDH